MKGIKRFRQAINNQRDFGNDEFHLTYHDAEEIADEIEDELSRLSGAEGVPAPVDADGEFVPLGVDKLFTNKGEMIRVGDIRYNGVLWSIRVLDSDKLYWVGALHCTEQDSWEQLEEDVEQFENGGTACEYFGSELKSRNECKSPCSIGANCRNGVARDVLRRAKALAERGDD